MSADDLSVILTKEESQGGYGHSPEAVWRKVAPRLIQDALRRLFEEKHLYQSIEVKDGAIAKKITAYWRELPPSSGGGATNWSTGGISGFASTHSSTQPSPKSPEMKAQEAEEALAEVLADPWRAEVLRSPSGATVSHHPMSGLEPGGRTMAEIIMFSAPRAVRTHCHFCDERVAFNPVSFFGFEAAAGWTGTGKSEDEQHSGYSYECQHCPGPKRGRVVFLLVRRGGKITLCGREPLEAVQVENYIPKPVRHYISNALIAHHAGQTLSGLFQLRTFIEQFWRSISAVEKARSDALATGKRLTGDELAVEYGKLLPEWFKQQYPSLGKVYGDLSMALHDAKDGDEATTAFMEALESVNEHFDARRVNKLV